MSASHPLRFMVSRGSWTAALLFLLLGQTGVQVAWAQTEDFQVLRWNGGVIGAQVGLGANLRGSGGGAFGGVLSPAARSGAEALFGNPAVLGLLTGHQVAIGGRAGLGTHTFGLGGDAFLPSAEIEARTDDFLADLNFPASGQPIYTDASNLNASQRGPLASLALAYRLHPRVTLAAGFHRPMDLQVDLRASGIEAFLDAAQESEGQTIDINVLMGLGLALDLDLNLHMLGAGLGVTLAKGPWGTLTMGGAINHYSAAHALSARVDPQGTVMLSRSQEYFFNDPGDPNLDPSAGESNRFYWRTQAQYEATAWGWDAGLVYALPRRGYNLSLAYHEGPVFMMKDPLARSQGRVPTFVNLDALFEADQDLFRVEDLNLAKPNLTRALSDSLGQSLQLTLPATLSAGIDLGLGSHTLSINYVHYLRSWAYEGYYRNLQGKDRHLQVGRDLSGGVRVGLDFRFPDRLTGGAWALIPIRLLFLDLDGLFFQALGRQARYQDAHFRVGGGVNFGEGRVADVGTTLGDALVNRFDRPMLSGLSLSRTYTVYEDLRVGVMVYGVPDLLLRVSLAYTLPPR